MKKYLPFLVPLTLALGLGVYSSVSQPRPAVVRPVTALERMLMDARATTDAGVRQRFLDAFLAENPIPHCPRIIYDRDFAQYSVDYNSAALRYGSQKRAKEANAETESAFHIARVIALKEMMGRGIESPIYASRALFDLTEKPTATKPRTHVYTLDTMRSVIKRHEGTHVLDVHDGLKIGSRIITHVDLAKPEFDNFPLAGFAEVRANYNQLEHLPETPDISSAVTSSHMEYAGSAFQFLYQKSIAGLPYSGLAREQLTECPRVKFTPRGNELELRIEGDLFRR